jgi:hypothetical protein
MDRVNRGGPLSLLWRTVLVMCLSAGPAFADSDRRRVADADWEALQNRSRDALVRLSESFSHTAPGEDDAAPAGLVPRTIVIGFTGGLEGQGSSVSGVVRMRRAIDAHFGESPAVTARAYSNFKWRRAASDVLALVRPLRADDSSGRQGQEAASRPSQPMIVVYGHSWGAGAIGKFARELRREGVDVSLAIYIDAFTLRNPRVPGNVRYAVNVYQRTGLLRGMPLRGKKQLLAQSPDTTTILGSLRIRPETDHFGWNWNLIQPLLYRHHHRIGHDARIQDFLLDLVALNLDR